MAGFRHCTAGDSLLDDLSLQQANFGWDHHRQRIVVTNHSQDQFCIGFEHMKLLAKAYDELSERMPELTRRFAKDETLQQDLEAINVAEIDSRSILRLVVRKLKHAVYMSAGIYEMLRDGSFHFYKDKNIRLDYYSDDLSKVVSALAKMNPGYDTTGSGSGRGSGSGSGSGTGTKNKKNKNNDDNNNNNNNMRNDAKGLENGNDDDGGDTEDFDFK